MSNPAINEIWFEAGLCSLEIYLKEVEEKIK